MALRALYQSKKGTMTAEETSNAEVVKSVLTNCSYTVSYSYITTVLCSYYIHVTT